MEIKDILEKTGIKSKEIRFLKQPLHPYIVFYDDKVYRGSDNKKSIVIDHSTTIELYTKEINQDDASIKLENVLMDELEVDFKVRREWIEEEAHFLTVYDFKFIENKRR